MKQYEALDPIWFNNFHAGFAACLINPIDEANTSRMEWKQNIVHKSAICSKNILASIL